MIYYRCDDSSRDGDRLLTIPTLKNAVSVAVRHAQLLGGWHIVFSFSGDSEVFRVWTRRNSPRTFKTLDAAAQFLGDAGVSEFVVNQYAQNARTTSRRQRTQEALQVDHVWEKQAP